MSGLAYGDIINGEARIGDAWTGMILAPSSKTSVDWPVWDMLVVRDDDGEWAIGQVVDILENTALLLRLTPDRLNP